MTTVAVKKNPEYPYHHQVLESQREHPLFFKRSDLLSPQRKCAFAFMMRDVIGRTVTTGRRRRCGVGFLNSTNVTHLL